jgi:hypothetical protein
MTGRLSSVPYAAVMTVCALTAALPLPPVVYAIAASVGLYTGVRWTVAAVRAAQQNPSSH